MMTLSCEDAFSPITSYYMCTIIFIKVQRLNARKISDSIHFMPMTFDFIYMNIGINFQCYGKNYEHDILYRLQFQSE